MAMVRPIPRPSWFTTMILGVWIGALSGAALVIAFAMGLGLRGLAG